MSILYGQWNRSGKPIDADEFRKGAAVTARYRSDRDVVHIAHNIAILYKAFETTLDGNPQPVVGSSGLILTWDGRLDNHTELKKELGISLSASVRDTELVLALLERWHMKSFAKLVGEWALAVWDPRKKMLLLGKDLAGTRQLYYTVRPDSVTWSTVLDPLVQNPEAHLELCEEYVVGYLSSFPATHLTPYQSIQAVPAGAYVSITQDAVTRYDYECFRSRSEIYYKTDADYEEHFRVVFGEAVRRRLHSSFPVLAELSGGMDSTAIVSMADSLLAKGHMETPRLDTLSYFDEEEPNWDERPYFSLVEKKRGRSGIHIDFGVSTGAFEPIPDTEFLPLPGDDQKSWERRHLLGQHCASGGYRILLSGIGGDEFLGGVPTPIPELADLLHQFRWVRFASRLMTWSFEKRVPWIKLFAETLRDFLPRLLRRQLAASPHPSWLANRLARRNRIEDELPNLLFVSGKPSFHKNRRVLDGLRRHLHGIHLDSLCPFAVSFPYLDRDLLEFLFAIPREQLVRPRQRRSLMRRALGGIVPAEILARPRKAYVSRRPLVLLDHAFPRIETLFRNSTLSYLAWIDGRVLAEALSAARQGQVERILPLLRVIELELWLASSQAYFTLPRPHGNLATPTERLNESVVATLPSSRHQDSTCTG